MRALLELTRWLVRMIPGSELCTDVRDRPHVHDESLLPRDHRFDEVGALEQIFPELHERPLADAVIAERLAVHVILLCLPPKAVAAEVGVPGGGHE